MFGFTVLASDDHLSVALAGEIDVSNVDELDAAFAALSGNIEVDCSGVTFISSAGFYSFERAQRATLSRGCTFAVFGLNSVQQRVAIIMGAPYVRSAIAF